MEPECSLPSLQELASGLYPETDESSTHTHPISLRSIIIWNYFLSGIFPSDFPAETLSELLPCAQYIPCIPHPP
jgi:hypothetical protein